MSSLFERCFHIPGAIDEKAKRLFHELANDPPAYYDGLRMVLMEGVKPVTKVKLPSGEIKEMLMLGSNSFLNLNFHPRVLEAAKKAQSRFGSGAGSPPLYAGTTELHEELEETLARFCGTESALLFPAGYSGNLGVISGLCRPGDAVFCDSSDHASLFDGARLSGAELIPYLHLNPRHLERALKHAPHSGKLIVTDGVFSMEGSLAPVDELVRLKEKYNSLLMVDDAHRLLFRRQGQSRSSLRNFQHGSGQYGGILCRKQRTYHLFALLRPQYLLFKRHARGNCGGSP